LKGNGLMGPLDEQVTTFDNKMRSVYGDEQWPLFERAYAFAAQHHQGQTRSSGEPFIVHPLAVAGILADMGMDPETVIAGLLHDVVEDTDASIEDVREQFGQGIADLVDGVTKLGQIAYENKEERQAESLRKMLLAMAKDIRVIIIKLADRLHNLRTLEYVDENRQRSKAYETLEIYAPLAHRLGMSKVKWELEDVSLRFIDPDGYYDLVQKVAKKRDEREAYIQEVIDMLNANIAQVGLTAEIEGRPKHFYSIYKKMYMQHKDFEQILDLHAVRVIVETVKDCYAVLGIVHTLWKPIPGRFKDYIAVPKPNMYQSLHTTVIGPRGEPFEIQIRTKEMHRTAEYGIAAHWKYKEGRTESDSMDKKLAWLRELLEWQSDLKDANEFMNALKIDLFTDEVFVFTPKGDVIDLPRGSGPLDFAYAIHSAVGDRCVGAKVNGKIVTLDYELKTGDIVEILTGPSTAGPSRDWLSIVKTSQARNKIKQWFKRERKEENIEKGKEMLEREAKRHRYAFSELSRPEWLEPIIRKNGFKSIQELYAAVGYGGVTVSQVIQRLIQEYVAYQKANKEVAIEDIKTAAGKSTGTRGVRVKGIDNVLIRFSKCCNPLPGDDIIGYITRGRGVSIHRRDCSNLEDAAVESHRFIEVAWENTSNAWYTAHIQITARDRKGLLGDVTRIINDMRLTLTAINARSTKNKMASIDMEIEIPNTEQLQMVMNKFNALDGVLGVYRING